MLRSSSSSSTTIAKKKHANSLTFIDNTVPNSSSTTVTKSKQTNSPNFYDNTRSNSSSLLVVDAQPEPIAPASARTYMCPKCDMVFSTPMAMGGHQNGHGHLAGVDHIASGTQIGPCTGWCSRLSLCINQNSQAMMRN